MSKEMKLFLFCTKPENEDYRTSTILSYQKYENCNTSKKKRKCKLLRHTFFTTMKRIENKK